MSLNWQNVHDLPELRPGELHVWLIKIDSTIEESLVGNLSEIDKEQARHLHLPQRRTEFIASRASLRGLLGGYLHLAPSAVPIEFSKDGKPRLGSPEIDLKFNLSHSGDFLLMAFMNGSEVGADIERINIDAMDDGTVMRSLHREELIRFKSLEDKEKSKFFFERWTMKEAFLKMLGCGFAIDPDAINLEGIGNAYEHAEGKGYFMGMPSVPSYCSSIATSAAPLKSLFYTPSSALLT
jgi:4'-phosphopantetheinyl transferase